MMIEKVVCRWHDITSELESMHHICSCKTSCLTKQLFYYEFRFPINIVYHVKYILVSQMMFLLQLFHIYLILCRYVTAVS
jgi:hypothetical protein